MTFKLFTCVVVLIETIVPSAHAVSPTQQGHRVGDSLIANQVLSGASRDYISPTPFDNFQLIMQEDCNLVLYNGTGVLWNSQTAGRGSGCRAVMQSDGNFVVYTSNNVPVWNSGTNGTPGAWIRMQDDGNAVVDSPSGAVWATGTDGKGFDLLSIASESFGDTLWLINQPSVRQRLTDYPQITFQTGDRIIVSAGGCVQTGGMGLTWKRYVDPSGDNSDHLYHGLIEIAGTTFPPGTPVRISTVRDSPVSVRSPTHLILGYEDDDYSDNGYWSHDNGTDDQCMNEPNAWVEVEVQRATPGPPPPPPPPPTVPFDLTWTEEDPAGLPMNPGWTGGNPDPNACLGMAAFFDNIRCSTDQPTTDLPSFPSSCFLGGSPIPGHVNWWPSSYSGTVFWHEKSVPDQDYNFWLDTQERGTVADQPAIGVEFYSNETIDHFQTPWWNAFHQAVDSSDEAAMAMLPGNEAIVNGLIGLDCEHGCPVEIHPLYGIAIHVKDDPHDDIWAIFARNWGNEGWCSSNIHFEDSPAGLIAFHLPWRQGADTVTVSNAPDDSDRLFLTNNPNVSGPGVQVAPQEGLIVSFNLPSPDAGARLNGELHLRWTLSAGALGKSTGGHTPQFQLDSKKIKVLKSNSLPPARKNLTTEKPDVEDRLSSLYFGLSEQRQQEVRAMVQTPAIPDATLLRPVTPFVVRVEHLSQRVARHVRVTDHSVKNENSAIDESRKIQAICHAYNGSVADFAGLCRNALPQLPPHNAIPR